MTIKRSEGHLRNNYNLTCFSLDWRKTGAASLQFFRGKKNVLSFRLEQDKCVLISSILFKRHVKKCTIDHERVTAVIKFIYPEWEDGAKYYCQTSSAGGDVLEKSWINHDFFKGECTTMACKRVHCSQMVHKKEREKSIYLFIYFTLHYNTLHYITLLLLCL